MFFSSHWLLSHITIVETTESGERGINLVAMTIVNPRKEYWPSQGSNQRPPALKSCTGHKLREEASCVLMKSRTNTKMGHVGSKTRSLGQILEKPCVCSRDQIFGLILINLRQSFCLDEILYVFENGSCRVKK